MEDDTNPVIITIIIANNKKKKKLLSLPNSIYVYNGGAFLTYIKSLIIIINLLSSLMFILPILNTFHSFIVKGKVNTLVIYFRWLKYIRIENHIHTKSKIYLLIHFFFSNPKMFSFWWHKQYWWVGWLSRIRKE